MNNHSHEKQNACTRTSFPCLNLRLKHNLGTGSPSIIKCVNLHWYLIYAQVKTRYQTISLQNISENRTRTPPWGRDASKAEAARARVWTGDQG